MSKHYLPLLTFLTLLVLVVGSLAVYRSYLRPSPQTTVTLSLLPSPTPNPTTTQVLGLAASESATKKIPLAIDSPLEGASVSSSLLTVSGQTASSAAVKVNDKEILSDTTGNFKTAIRLVQGANLLVIEASSSAGNAIWQTVITYVP